MHVAQGFCKHVWQPWLDLCDCLGNCAIHWLFWRSGCALVSSSTDDISPSLGYFGYPVLGILCWPNIPFGILALVLWITMPSKLRGFVPMIRQLGLNWWEPHGFPKLGAPFGLGMESVWGWSLSAFLHCAPYSSSFCCLGLCNSAPCFDCVYWVEVLVKLTEVATTVISVLASDWFRLATLFKIRLPPRWSIVNDQCLLIGRH